MKYFLLQNRRHLGPYTLEHLAQLRSEQAHLASSYVLSEENQGLGKLNYEKLDDVLSAKKVPLSSTAQGTLQVASKKEKFEFPEEEAEELQKTFASVVEPLDLVKTPGQTQVTPPPPPSSQSISSPLSWIKRVKSKVESLSTASLVGAIVVIGVLFLVQGFFLSQKTAQRKAEFEATQQAEAKKNPLPATPGVVAGGPTGGGGSLSKSLNLGPAVPAPTIRIPERHRAPTSVREDEVIDVEQNIEQGDTPEPSLIKKAGKKKRQRIDEGLDGEPGMAPDRDPANEGEDLQPGEEAYDSGAPQDDQAPQDDYNDNEAPPQD